MSASQEPTARRSTRLQRTLPPRGEAPLVLDRYRLHRRLGAGGFGTVWLARDERLDREVAVKILPRARLVGGRLEREARATARLSHPGIVTLYEAAVDDDGAYLVSELVRGSTLDALLADGRISDRDVLLIAIVLCDALAHAHAQGVVHRDVKPSNVLVPDAPVSPDQVAKLTDFGIARVIGGDSLTRTGDVIGTLAYMAPEQAEGREAGSAADLYSLALVIYEALTGINPVSAAPPAQRARRLGGYLPPLRRRRRDLPRELGRAVDLALRPRPRERGTIGDLRSALRASLQEVGDLPGMPGARWRREEAADPSACDPGTVHPWSDEAIVHPWSDPGTDHPRSDPRPGEPRRRRQDLWLARGLGALTAALLAGLLCSRLLPASPLAPAAAGLIAGALTLVAPRIGFAALTVGICMSALLKQQPGAALVVVVGALVPVVTLPRRPQAWPLAVAAPALGLIGLAGAWPGLSAAAATAWRRAALGATGWIWLALAGPISGRAMYLPHVPGTSGLATWSGSAGAAVHHLLLALISTGALAGAPVWGLAAAVAPWLIRRRSPIGDAVRVLVWAAIVVGATTVGFGLLGGRQRLGMPPTAVIGAMASASVALAPSVIATRLALRRSSGPRAGFA